MTFKPEFNTDSDFCEHLKLRQRPGSRRSKHALAQTRGRAIVSHRIVPRYHLDGYNQLELLNGQGPSKRHELWYFGGPKLGALRLDDFKYQFYDQPLGWPGPKVVN
jgi:hypothetical protein